MEQVMGKEAVEALLEWYRRNKRDLPWRHTKDPYAIWISEIMLQQTRVEAVKPYYSRFLETFPTVESLSNADEQKLMKCWEGLGYYSRARNLKKAALRVMECYGGTMPDSFKELKTLCGIGDYTAGAIASIAFGEQVPAVDGNVLRVLSRLTECGDDIALQQTKKMWADRLQSTVPTDAGDFNQALIEIGATVCVPNGEANCQNCPLAADCRAFQHRTVDNYPVKSAKKPRRIEERTVLLIRDGDRTALHKRPAKGLLAGLYELPNFEGHIEEDELPERIRALGFEPLRIIRIEDAKHIFTHIEWHMIAYSVMIAAEFDGYHQQSGMQLVRNQDLHEHYAIPSAFSAYQKYL